MVDLNDVGRFALAAFRSPRKFGSQEIKIASKLLTVDEVMVKLARATSRDIKAVCLSDAEIKG
ncbi:hypothetical protein LZ32DRAFT_601943 [Colletotrichum eremochloae]|nr:hypothetical protein LZ32DRAFT_601943 [Colletotrichum eremochloae]